MDYFRIYMVAFLSTVLVGSAFAERDIRTIPMAEKVDQSNTHGTESSIATRKVVNNVTHRLVVNAQDNCVFLTDGRSPEAKTARLNLKPNHRYMVTASGEAFMSKDSGAKADPFPGVTVFYCSNEEDGYAARMAVLKSGESVSFVTPKRMSHDLFVSAFFVDFWPESRNRGQYELLIHEEGMQPLEPEFSTGADRILNINFGLEPRNGVPNAAIGASDDVWTLIDVGETEKTSIPYADGSSSGVDVTVSENDGEWGLADHFGVGHAYLYHNNRSVDLSVTLSNLPCGLYDVYVFAHGDAPNQNAAIDVVSDDVLYTGKSTVNDGTWSFRDQQPKAGGLFVKYTVTVVEDSPMTITSKRDGSNLSMFNAIQVKRID